MNLPPVLAWQGPESATSANNFFPGMVLYTLFIAYILTFEVALEVALWSAWGKMLENRVFYPQV